MRKRPTEAVSKAGGVGKRKGELERELHKRFGDLLEILRPNCIWFPVPNGAADLGAKLGGILKAQHKVKEGVSDWVFMWGDGGGQLELKSLNGIQSDDQVKMEFWCRSKNVQYEIARSLPECVAVLEKWGRLRPGTAGAFRDGRICRQFADEKKAPTL